MATFEINLHDLEKTGKDYTFPIDASWLAKVLEGTDVRADGESGAGTLEFRADKSGSDVVVHGHARAHLVAPCYRCLEDARIDADAELSVLLTARSEDHRREPDEDELSPEELDREFFTGEKIGLDDLVREHLLLEVPMQPLCREDCPGIEIPAHLRAPADFGVEKGIDPRLKPLMKLASLGQAAAGGERDPEKE